MSFPTDPLDVKAELYLGSDWVNVTSDVMLASGITVTRGRQNETTKLTTPSKCSFQLKNGSGNYDVRNPVGAWFGQFGRNTPLRVGVRTARDTFSRTVSNGWGTADTGQGWTLSNGVAADFAVNGTAATHSVAGTADSRMSWLSGFSQRDVDLKVDVSLSLPSVTGGAIEPANLLLRLVDVNNYYMIRVVVAVGGAITLDIHSVVANAGTSLVGATATGLTYAPNSTYTVRAAIENQVIKAKIWAVGTGEPYAWTASVRDSSLPDAGSVGIRSGVAGGNTNTHPISFTYDNFEVMSPRFAGEIASIIPRTDKTQKKKWVEVDAADIFRRWEAGATPLRSTLRRGYQSLSGTTKPVAYWPLEDGSQSTSGASGLIGGTPMDVTQGSINFGAFSGFDCSLPVATPNNGTLHGSVPAYPAGGGQVRWLMRIPATGLTDGQAIATFHTSGALARWRLTWHTGGGLKITAFDTTLTAQYTGPAVGFGAADVFWLMHFGLTQNGANVDWKLTAYQIGSPASGSYSDTVLGWSFQQITDVYLTPDKDITALSFGHVVVQPVVTGLFDLLSQLTAYKGEQTAFRVARLASENGSAAASYRSLQNPEPMSKLGSQLSKTVVDLLEETAVADMSLIFANRSNTELTYRTYPSMLSQTPRIALNAANGEVADQPAPVDDDQALVNDVTATRMAGSSFHVTQTTGRLSTAPSTAGGVGTYASDKTYNVATEAYLPGIAGWTLYLGTYDGPRYPQVSVKLQSARISGNATLMRQIRDANLGDIITVANLNPDTEYMLILGYTETLSAFAHEFTFNCSPGRPWSSVAVADDATLGRADSSGSTLASGVTAAATSLTVNVASGPVWTTAAAQFPFDILVAGERMTVTNIAGTSSPQTFTVTRAANGISKAQVSGAAVVLFQPAIAAAGKF